MPKNDNSDTIKVIGFSGKKFSDDIEIIAKHKKEFIKFIEDQYIFTNEGSGLTVDYYFSRFDEVLAVIDPEYVKQHGIFFTDDNLSKFALWFAKNEVFETIHDNYVVFDPAGGSGNLISSYKGKLKHKIISELQPDLLKIIEKRMKADPWHIETGFTIVPKTIANEGLNFLDRSGADYYQELEKAVLQSTKKPIDKPLAFLLNPPYKNTKENVVNREEKDANYNIHQSIINIAGEDASIERYLAFLGQIINISIAQQIKVKGKQIVLIFTPTSWLIPRPAFVNFRNEWDKHFKYINGFIVTSNEFFKLDGKWPLAFTIWEYNFVENKNENKIKINDFTSLKKNDLAFNWNNNDEELSNQIEFLINDKKRILFDNKTKSIRETYDLKLYDFIRNPTNTELNSKNIIGGLPLKDERRENKKTYGITDSNIIGFMDNLTPVRIKTRGEINRFSENNLNSVWFRLDTSMKDINKSNMKGGATDNRSYCAYDQKSAEGTFSWYALTKCLVGKYPTWANQYDLWQPNIPENLKIDWFALCYAFGLAENRCVVTKFEADNPVLGAPEVWVDNPMSPNNQDSFYRTTLQAEIKKSKSVAINLAIAIEEFYQFWNLNYTKGQVLENVGLENEAYFKYFDYPDFVTKDSGLVQIKKYADINECADLLEKIALIQEKTKRVKEVIYNMLIEDFKYFD